jgi:uncharacterized membrane protein YhaH (DUF805 family)
MDFRQAVKKCLNDYATFPGRAARPEYWWFILFTFLVSVGASILDGAFGGRVVQGLASLALLLPTLAVTSRRLHDIDRSAWWMLLWLIPVIGQLVLIYFCVQPGTAGSNRFGAPPPA